MDPFINKQIRLSDYVVEVPFDLEPLLPGFMKRRWEELSLLKDLIKLKDLPEIARIGHKMKGHGLGYGFEAISLVGQMLELKAKENDIISVKLLVNNLEDLLNEIDLTKI